jgi:hypothetical protein
MKNVYKNVIITESLLLALMLLSIIWKDMGKVFLPLLIICFHLTELFFENKPWKERIDNTYVLGKIGLLKKPLRYSYYFLLITFYLFLIILAIVFKPIGFDYTPYIKVIGIYIYLISLYRAYLIVQLGKRNLL